MHRRNRTFGPFTEGRTAIITYILKLGFCHLKVVVSGGSESLVGFIAGLKNNIVIWPNAGI